MLGCGARSRLRLERHRFSYPKKNIIRLVSTFESLLNAFIMSGMCLLVSQRSVPTTSSFKCKDISRREMSSVHVMSLGLKVSISAKQPQTAAERSTVVARMRIIGGFV
jgi:hypothetical protein